MSNDLFEGLNTPPVVVPPKKKTDWRGIYVNFRTHQDVQLFAQTIDRSINANTKDLRFPPYYGSTITELFDIEEGASYEEPAKRKRQQHDDLNEDLFDYEYDPEFYDLHWVGMPEFHQPDSSAIRKITCWFKTAEDIKQFEKMIKQKIGVKTPSIWFPDREKNSVADLYWISTNE